MRQQNTLMRKFAPVVQNVMSNLGKLSTDKKEVKQIEQAILGDVQENIGQMFPEIDLLTDLGIISPETMEKITANPWTLPILVQRYGPLVKTLMGRMKQGQGQQGFDA